MKRKANRFLHQVLAALLTIAALAVGQTVQAQSTWTVTNSSLTSFIITRSDTSTEEKIYFRTVSLSSIEGICYGAKYGILTFEEGESQKIVEITHYDIAKLSGDQMLFQFVESSFGDRTYRFEVLDITARTVLASATAKQQYDGRYVVYSDYINKDITDLVYLDEQGNFASGLPSGKYRDIHSSSYEDDSDGYERITDQGYTQNTAIDFLVYDDFTCHVTSVIDYLNKTGAKIYATACFTMYEEMDGYQYIQIAIPDDYDSDDDPNGGVNDPVNSLYKSCFILSYTPSGSVMPTPHHQFFPHRYDYENWSAEKAAGISHYEFDYYNSYLYQQKFKAGYRASKSGAVLLPYNTGRIALLFDAGGGGDVDAWHVKKDIFLRLAVGDDIAPTRFSNSNPVVTAGYHHRGSRETISVPFSEIVKVSGTAYLYTSWGKFTYEAGSGSNVLAFTGIIDAEPGTQLSITGISSSVTDLAGNAAAWPSAVNLSATVSALNDISDHFFVDSEGRALISSQSELQRLADYVNGGHDCNGINFLQTAPIIWNGTYMPIGTNLKPFRGTYDGGGNPITGIRDISSTEKIGVFGAIENSTVQNIVLSGSTITGNSYVGGIVGYMSASTVQNCYVNNDVTIQAGADNASYLGSIAGLASNGSTIAGCYSHARVTDSGRSNCTSMGGILGESDINYYQSTNYNTIQDCFYTSIYKLSNAIVGEASKTIFNRVYYYSPLNIFSGGGEISVTCTGSPSFAHTITLGENIVLTGTQATYNVGRITTIGDNVLRVDGVNYCAQGKTVTVDDIATPNGYDATTFTVNGTTISGKSFEMPDENVEVNVATGTYVPITYSINYVLNDGTNNPGNPTTYNVESADITLGAPTRTRFYFDGWYTDDALTSAASAPHIPTGSTGDKTFYAKWLWDVTLNDNASNNTSTIDLRYFNHCHVTLNGRTLYKDGYWNTLCLPFAVDIANAPLAGDNVKVMTLDPTTTNFSDGILTLNFVECTGTISAGTPFIIKWDGDGTNNIENPVFNDVYISMRTARYIASDVVNVTGTFDKRTYDDDNHKILFLGAGNTLYYPEAGASIGAFRAYFTLKSNITAGDPAGDNNIKAFVLNFGDETETGIVSMEDERGKTEDVWYNLSGRKLSGKPTQRGIYINNGRKVVIK